MLLLPQHSSLSAVLLPLGLPCLLPCSLSYYVSPFHVPLNRTIPCASLSRAGGDNVADRLESRLFHRCQGATGCLFCLEGRTKGPGVVAVQSHSLKQ